MPRAPSTVSWACSNFAHADSSRRPWTRRRRAKKRTSSPGPAPLPRIPPGIHPFESARIAVSSRSSAATQWAPTPAPDLLHARGPRRESRFVDARIEDDRNVERAGVAEDLSDVFAEHFRHLNFEHEHVRRCSVELRFELAEVLRGADREAVRLEHHPKRIEHQLA